MRSYLRLREHVQAPGAHLAVSGNADQVVGVLGANHVDAVDRMLQRRRGRGARLWENSSWNEAKAWTFCLKSYRMRGGRERRPLHRGPLVAPVVPQNNLARVCAPDHHVGVELGEGGGHNGGLSKSAAKKKFKKMMISGCRKRKITSCAKKINITIIKMVNIVQSYSRGSLYIAP